MTDKFLILLGNRVRNARGEKYFSQAELSIRCGLDRTYISGIESGKRNPSILSLKKVAIALEVPLASLLTDIKG
ncbi:XRE family transcriptional regulator [Erwinia billingiae]|uniref:helix-turn-helix domain-containing protein n=1 Tax=Erwinia billingiae TaxID=182337 RepID=UPI001243A553|nr:helix-turn-helix transcriptional regulator [Erwinia billingiae]QEW32009.1 XRE family transcriptional regulator [Erwinia billingiae]